MGKFSIIFSFFVLCVSFNLYSEQGEPIEYVVQKGDTVSEISSKFGVSVQEITFANNIHNPSRIRAGQKLIIPAPNQAAQKKAGTSIQKTSVAEPVSDNEKSGTLISSEATVSEEGSVTSTETKYLNTKEKLLEPSEAVPQEETQYEESCSVKKETKRYIIGGGVSYWLSNLDAQVKVDGADIIGTKIDLSSDLGVDSSQGIPTFNVWVQPFSRLRLSIYYTDFKISGSKDINEQIAFENTVFPIETRVTGELGIQRFSGVIELNILQSNAGYLGTTVGVDFFNLEAALSATGFGKVEADYQAGAATLGLKGGINLPLNFSVEGRARALILDISDFDIRFIDAEGGLYYTVLDHFSVYALFRYWLVQIEKGDDSGRISMNGPVIGVEIKF